jgi:hypothetical protein
MTTTVTTDRVILVANGVTPLPFTFQAISDAEVGILRNGVEQLGGFDVELNGDGTGTVTPLDDWGADEVTIFSKPSFEQPANFGRFTAFYPDQFVPPLDRLARTAIALKEQKISLPLGDIRGRFLAFDAAGEPIATDASGADSALRSDLAADTGGALILHKMAGSGTFARTLRQWGAMGGLDDANIANWIDSSLDPGILDGSNAIDLSSMVQQGLDTATGDIRFPDGKFLISSINMPVRQHFSVRGTGMGSKLIQKAGATSALIHWPTRATTCLDAHQTISDLYFDAANGSQHVVDTTYAQVIDLVDLYFNEVPNHKACIKVDGNPTDGTYSHDVRISRARCYVPGGSLNNGSAGILMGAHSADSSIERFIMQGFFLTDYCILAEAGALTCAISECHPYNAKINVLKLAGGNNDFGFDGNVFDNALADIVKIVGSSRGRWSNNWIEAVPSAFSGIVLDNSSNHEFKTTNFHAAGVGRASCVTEINGSDGNRFDGGVVDALANFTTPFNLTGAASFAAGFKGDTPKGSISTLQFSGSAAQAQNTTLFYGANGDAANNGATAWRVAGPGRVKHLKVYLDVTPAAGQTFTFTLLKNNVSIGSATVNAGSFSATITPAYSDGKFAEGDAFSVKSVFSATSGSGTIAGALVIQQ